MTLDQCDALIQRAARDAGGAHAILCLYTGSRPPYCAPMDRDPIPALQWPLRELAAEFAKAVTLNPAVEDGVAMFGRDGAGEPYRAVGWSFRLFPPPASVAAIANRGSAFNSCLLMSRVSGVDALYQLSAGTVWRFHQGLAAAL